MIAWAKKQAQKELEGQLAVLLPLIESFSAQDLMKDVLTKEPLLPAEVTPPAEFTVKPIAPVAPQDQPVAPRRNTSQRRSNKQVSKKTEPVESGATWDEMPKLEELT